MTDMFPFEIIFNILVGVMLFIYWGVAFMVLYHLARFGVGVQPKKFAAIFLFGSLVLSTLVIFFLIKIDITVLIPK